MKRDKALSSRLALRLLSCFERDVSQITMGKTTFSTFLRSVRCSPFVIQLQLAITERARKNKRTARMLANARKDHSIPLFPSPEAQTALDS